MTTCTNEELQAEKLRAVADWFRDCKTLTLETLPVGLIAALEAGAAALTEARAEIAELTTAYNELVKAEAKAYDDGHADAKRQAQRERDGMYRLAAIRTEDAKEQIARAEAAEAEIIRLEARCGELCDAHEAQFIRAEAAEAEQGRLLHGDDGGPEV